MATIHALVREADDLASWENQAIPEYLAALGAWLADGDGFYANRKQVRPSNAWQTIGDALLAATIYE